MTDTILVLTEDTLNPADVHHILSLHEGGDVTYRVLVPADTEHNVITSIIDYVSVGELKEAWDQVLGREPDSQQAKATAAAQLAESLRELREAGADANGEITADDPLPTVEALVRSGSAREVVVVTYPHAVEDTFHTDWASKARTKLNVPVLHLYSGTSELGD